ncbi:DUF1643 domain-containing protein [Methylobacterium isbiliense]|uniref:DUF1643 domain-containing protein n=1 Tax=Methylobacterium isbiliense TaxID=315478 RepID=A0ABQ4SIR6_9HYPH|nr:DUF1643 domain-containing protein [Methylobacterium isbiliense]MDN3623681.1 DUF1643 domain-containing protein [Methylobacterium isbiliense]GJE03105.1 hypothetical protein GMJLKIPL_5056 [Methylobacterium isbiliense]
MSREIRASALFSACGQFRHRLDRSWSDEPRALVCGCNPSMAGTARNDPTVCRLRALLRDRPGLGGFTLVNAEERIATDPADLARWLAGLHLPALQAQRRANLARIRALAAEAALCIVAWGNLVPPGPPADRVAAALSLDGRRPLYAFGFVGDGAPIHPLARGRSRVPLGAPLVEWRVGEG